MTFSADGRASFFTLNGRAPAPLTHWSSSPIFSFDWSRDGKWLAYASGSLTSDVILITDAGH